MAVDIQEIRERKSAATAGWQEVRAEAAIDMKFVAGDPWDETDKQQRKHRPTIAPEEMGQYFNQVINQLWANPRAMKFAPVGNGADEDGATFYQAKARETEYRSNAKVHYTTAASNAIQRSYGFVRVFTEYESPRSANQEICIGGFPDPDMVEPDPEALMPDSSDMKWCFVNEWMALEEVKRAHPKAKTPSSLAGWSTAVPGWVAGNKVLRAEYWYETTKRRKLVLVRPKALPMPGRTLSLVPPQAKPYTAFRDELHPSRLEGSQIEDLRDVDYPTVRMCLTDGLEILSEHDWPGRYIPIVSCYGKILFVPNGGVSKRVILSMTRFGRDPWKAMCYAASQQLEVLSQVPKAPFWVAAGQLTPKQAAEVNESLYIPKAFIEYTPVTEYTGNQPLPPPPRIDYPAGEHLQAIEIVKEGFRRAIQSAMGSNFLPTEAQGINQKSGVALGKIDNAATSGTFHFVNNYEDMIRRVGIIFEDLVDKIYDYAGETGTLNADGTAKVAEINQPGGVSTQGDYQVTVSTGPSSDSEREAALEFGSALLPQLPQIAQMAGPQAAAALLAQIIRLQAGGPLMDQMADLIAPPEFKGKDGKPLPPEAQALVRQLQMLQAKLQQAEQALQTKQVEQQGQFQIAKYKADATSQDKAADRAVKLDVAAIEAKIETMAMVLEELQRIGGLRTDAAERLHAAAQASLDRQHEHVEHQKDRAHDLLMAHVTSALQPPAPPAGASNVG